MSLQLITHRLKDTQGHNSKGLNYDEVAIEFRSKHMNNFIGSTISICVMTHSTVFTGK